MADEDSFDDLDDEQGLLKRIRELESKNRELAGANKLLEDDHELNLSILEDIRAYFEVRFPALKDFNEECGFLDEAFKELDKLQDSYDEIMNYVTHIFPDLKDVAQKDIPAVVISRIDELKKNYSKLEGQSQPQPSAQAAAPSDQYKHELDAVKKESEETKQRLEAELQNKEKQLAESGTAHSGEINTLQGKLDIADSVARYILGNECFAEYQKQSFSNEDARLNWIAKMVYDAFVPINESDPHAHQNARLHAEARKKKLSELAPKVIAGADEYMNALKSLGKTIEQHSNDVSKAIDQLKGIGEKLDQLHKQYDE